LKKVILSVINDLSTEQRVDKVCKTLIKMGFEPLMVGRKKRDSLPLEEREYTTRRMRLVFEKGPCFYAEFNLRLFFFLLFHKSNLLVSNDLDTLLANRLVSRIKGVPMVYDTHEYYTETPELVNRKFVQGIWRAIEKAIFPKLKHVYTVNESIAGLYRMKYGNHVRVVRNVPIKREQTKQKTREELGLPSDRKIILMQGAGINIQRGAEEMMQAMQFIDGAVFVIIGGGDVMPVLKRMNDEIGLKDRVLFIPKQPMNKIFDYTVHADLGVTLDKDTNINYRFSLPNKLFDYIQAGVPILASPLTEIKKIIDEYEIGSTIDNHDPQHIADKINGIFQDRQKLGIWKENLKFAANTLCWEKEEEVVKQIYQPFV
jgi:glycosyltransferase involved in cell wall biosynthesis